MFKVNNYFYFPSVSIVNFEHVINGWENLIVWLISWRQVLNPQSSEEILCQSSFF